MSQNKLIRYHEKVRKCSQFMLGREDVKSAWYLQIGQKWTAGIELITCMARMDQCSLSIKAMKNVQKR